MTPSDLDKMADDFWSSMAMGRTETRAFARTVAAACYRDACDKVQHLLDLNKAIHLACNKEPVQFTDSTGRKALIPCDGVKIVGTVEPNDAKVCL
jgi:hypothetical protein